MRAARPAGRRRRPLAGSLAGVFSLLWLGSAPALAEVSLLTPQGFDIQHAAHIEADPRRAYQGFIDIAAWWDPAHTFSGEAGRLSLVDQPGGCWCERLPNGGFVEHLRVIAADPGARLRLQGGLGPLQDTAASGVMTVTFTPDQGGVRVHLLYRVRGLSNPDAWAGPVDAVLGAGIARFEGLFRGND